MEGLEGVAHERPLSVAESGGGVVGEVGGVSIMPAVFPFAGYNIILDLQVDSVDPPEESSPPIRHNDAS